MPMSSADELNVNLYICIGPDAISRKHRDIKPGCENQANAVRNADEATLPVVGLKRRSVLATALVGPLCAAIRDQLIRQAAIGR